jgi:pyruvate/2-oxoglutarate/acetoin dehydrogenase E1 component
MKKMHYTQAIDDALGQAMFEDDRIIIFGEDVPLLRPTLLVRFGPDRIKGTPISESAFIGAGIAAAMAGLRPVIEVYMVDFLGVAMDALLNHAAKLESFTGGRWKAPFVLRTPCGGGYGDGGQHMQSLWGWLAHIPGLSIVIPSTPADAGGLMYAALHHDGPVIFMEHKLLSETARNLLGSGGRETVHYDLPILGTFGDVPNIWSALPFGQACYRRNGNDLIIVSVGVGVHRALQAAEKLEKDGIYAGVLDLRTLVPLDKHALCDAIAQTGRLLVVDEDYEQYGLSGELAAVALEAGLSFKYARVCTKTTIPYAEYLQNDTLPNVKRIYEYAKKLVNM